MILVTGATGFIGRALVRQLFEAGHPIRVLIRPSRRTPRLPKGVPVEVAVVSLADTRGLRAALNGVDVIFHAARASAYPVFKAKGIAEETIRRSGIPYTILRSAIVYGPEDHFTNGLARMLRAAPGIFFIPSSEARIVPRVQPIWVEDLAACLLWTYANPETLNQVYEVGGSEYFTVRQVVEIVMSTIHAPRLLIEIPPLLLRALAIFLEGIIPRFPASSFWIDYLYVSRTCPADATSRAFGLMPARFTYRLDYLVTKSWWQCLSGWFAKLRPSRARR